MYGSYQNQDATTAKWFFFGFIGIVLMAVLLGANIKDAKWLNPNIAAAEAQQLAIETAHRQATYALEEQLKAAQTSAEIQAIQREQKLLDAQYQGQIQGFQQDLVHQDLAFRTLMTAFTFLAGALAVALVLTSTIWISSRVLINVRSSSRKEEPMHRSIPAVAKRIPNVAERVLYDALYSSRLDSRLQEISVERQEAEQLAARLKTLSNSANENNREYKKRPLAGD